MSAQQRQVDNIANNLANVNTTGFKRSSLAFQDLFYQNIPVSKRGASVDSIRSDVPELQIGHGARVVATIRNFSQGSISETGNPLDLSVNGAGFFQVQMPDGSTAYTRDGNFTINAEGMMINNSGLILADRIEIPHDSVALQVSQDGVVSALLDGDRGQIELGQIELAKFVNPAGLRAIGDNLFVITEASGQPFHGIPGVEGIGSLQQGYLEQSNVDIVSEMVKLIEAQRAYELNSKMVQTAEEMMSVTNAIKR